MELSWGNDSSSESAFEDAAKESDSDERPERVIEGIKTEPVDYSESSPNENSFMDSFAKFQEEQQQLLSDISDGAGCSKEEDSQAKFVYYTSDKEESE